MRKYFRFGIQSRKEIEDIIGDEEINADHLKEMKYTENVIHEAMRKYFRFGIQRTCTRDYKIPDSDFTIPKDLLCTVVPREEDCFPNPDKFDSALSLKSLDAII